jgi:excisionase family DNA binding protein
MVIAGGCRSVTERDIVEFEARFLGISASPSEEDVKRKRKSTEITASVWMICAIAQELASRTELHELWSGRLPVIERLTWCDSVRPGDELGLKIEILDRRLSISSTASWVRWQWILATAVGVRALDLMAGSFLEDHSPSQNDRVGLSANRISYKVTEAAKMVGLSRYVLYDAIRNMELPAYRPSPRGDFVLLPDDLRAWVTRFRAHGK